VTGIQKLKPCGTAVAGMLLPREKLELEWVPRVVETQSDGRDRSRSGGSASIVMSSIQAPKSVGPSGLSYATRMRSMRLPAATAPIRERLKFHWLV
jgi:hypothetical protein